MPHGLPLSPHAAPLHGRAHGGPSAYRGHSGANAAIPETSQWALFLRNHDELTLEMVTDEERDYMYRMYAHVDQARLNLGIRRRLAPLMNNDRKSIELLNALLFSLPGTPVLYYGDEIGLGENIFLGDRNGVRTPMQWSSDKNAGFSRANPQSLYLPIILDPGYHYEANNVEVQLTIRTRCCGGCGGCWPCESDGARWAKGNASFSKPKTAKFSATSLRYEKKRFWSSPTSPAFHSQSKLDLSAFQQMRRPSNYLAGRNSPSSTSGLISCRSGRTHSIGFHSNPSSPALKFNLPPTARPSADVGGGSSLA
jgi:hypothetical protein